MAEKELETVELLREYSELLLRYGFCVISEGTYNNYDISWRVGDKFYVDGPGLCGNLVRVAAIQENPGGKKCVVLATTPKKVRVVRQHGLKADGWYEKTRHLVFNVIRARHGGYDVDLAPVGHPRTSGWLYEEEAEVVEE